MLDKVNQDITTALKAGDKPTAEALKLVKSALMYARIAAGHDLNEEEATKIIRKEMKSRVEARDMYRNNDRPELADKEEFERATYAKYVPEELGESAIDAVISEQAKALGSDATFAQLMPKVMQALAGKADGKVVSERVKVFIGGKN